MELRKLNLILLIVFILLLLNIFFDFNDLTAGIVKENLENLKCEINGNFVDDINLCCHEMQKFLKCENNRCNSKNYEILFDNNLLTYCKKSGYDVRS